VAWVSVCPGMPLCILPGKIGIGMVFVSGMFIVAADMKIFNWCV